MFRLNLLNWIHWSCEWKSSAKLLIFKFNLRMEIIIISVKFMSYLNKINNLTLTAIAWIMLSQFTHCLQIEHEFAVFLQNWIDKYEMHIIYTNLAAVDLSLSLNWIYWPLHKNRNHEYFLYWSIEMPFMT